MFIFVTIELFFKGAVHWKLLHGLYVAFVGKACVVLQYSYALLTFLCTLISVIVIGFGMSID